MYTTNFVVFLIHVVVLDLLAIHGNSLPLWPTTTPRGFCTYNGKIYSPGTLIKQGQSGTWCYSSRCDWSGSGQIIYADDFNCSPPTTTTEEPTTTPFGPPPGFCKCNDKLYSPGTMIEHGQSGTWCYSSHCDWSGSGQVIHEDNFNCSPPTTTTTTVTE